MIGLSPSHVIAGERRVVYRLLRIGLARDQGGRRRKGVVDLQVLQALLRLPRLVRLGLKAPATPTGSQRNIVSTSRRVTVRTFIDSSLFEYCDFSV